MDLILFLYEPLNNKQLDFISNETMNPSTILITIKIIFNCKLIVANNFIKRIIPYPPHFLKQKFFKKTPAKIIELEFEHEL